MRNAVPKIKYDKESGVLSIQLAKGKSVDSDIQDNVVIDYGKMGKIVRINLYNFSFGEFQQRVSVLKQFSRNSRIPMRAR